MTKTENTELAKVPENPIEKLGSLLDENGEMDLAKLQLGARMQKFLEFRQQVNANLPLWETNLLTQFPEGTTLLPMPVYPAKSDAWRGSDAKAMKLKEGHVEPSADFIIKLGNLLGIELEKDFEGVTEESGTKMYACRYNAYLTLPNGARLAVMGEGKDQELYTGSGSKQAHIAESTRKKAKRNAIKCLLGIPTSMPEEEFDRPWILLRPIFHEGVDPATDRIIAEQKQQAETDKKQLYQTIDVQAEAQGDGSIEEIVAHIKAVTTMAQLEELVKAAGDVKKTEAERKQVVQAYQEQKTFIESVAKQEQGGGF